MGSVPTVFTQLSNEFPTFVPYVEEAAYFYAMYSSVLPPRTTVKNDMSGWNVRKVSEFVRNRRAVQLAEATAIPQATLDRIRTAEVSPLEWGDRYPVTDRTVHTSLEDLLGTVITYLGQSLGMRKEKQVAKTLLSALSTNNVTGSPTTNYTFATALGLVHEFSKRAWATEDPVYHIIHPFQAMHVRKDLADLSKPADNVTRASINRWIMSGGMGVEVVETPTLPRKIKYKLAFDCTGGTFTLRAGELANGNPAITAPITYNATPATLATNIKTALDALGIGTWTVSGSAVDNMTVQAPHYVDAEDELLVHQNNLTGGAASLTISERSASALSIMYSRSAVILDIREPIRVHGEFLHAERIYDIMAYEKYGVALWRGDRVLFYETDASSPFAVGS